MKMDQVAFYAKTDDDVTKIKAMLGLTDKPWIEDLVTAKSLFPDGHWEINKGKLLFNYDFGMELEILRYEQGRHWHFSNNGSIHKRDNPMWVQQNIFTSHVGIHLDDNEQFPVLPATHILVQETFTQSHTSEYLTTGDAAGRKYHYKIYEMVPGTYVKYIKRIHPGK